MKKYNTWLRLQDAKSHYSNFGSGQRLVPAAFNLLPSVCTYNCWVPLDASVGPKLPWRRQSEAMKRWKGLSPHHKGLNALSTRPVTHRDYITQIIYISILRNSFTHSKHSINDVTEICRMSAVPWR